MRYGVAIARGNLYEPGTYTIQRKVEWPNWTPTQNMIARDPELYGPVADGVDPGPENPLGSRALYLLKATETPIYAFTGRPNQEASAGARVRGVSAWSWHISTIYTRTSKLVRRRSCIRQKKA